MAAGKRQGGAVEKKDPIGVRPLGPEAKARSFARALVRRDAAAAAGHLAPEARIVTPDGTELAGRIQVTAVLAQLADSEHELEIRVGRTVVSGQVALCTQLWRRRSRGAEEGFEDQATSRLVLVRGEEDWEIVIVSPWE